MKLSVEDRVWIPIDTRDYAVAERLVADLIAVGAKNFKIGLEFITAVGARAAVKLVQDRGGRVFYDGKFCDIPNTVAGASKAVAELGVDIFNVLAWCGKEGMAAAVAIRGISKVLAVTVLTSMNNQSLLDIGFKEMFGLSLDDYKSPAVDSERLRKLVRDMAIAAKSVSVDGSICSPKELQTLGNAEELWSGFMKVTPGVRPSWAAVGDQKRVMTPGEAIRAGATALVIGRPITSPPPEVGSPADALKRIYDEIAAALPT